MPINPLSTSPAPQASATTLQAPTDADVREFQAVLAKSAPVLSEAQAIAEFEKRLANDILRKIVKDGCDDFRKVFSR